MLRALPGGRCYVTASLLRVSASGWKQLSAGLTPASGVGTTRLEPARTAWFVCRRLHRSHASGCCARPCGCVRAIRACALQPSLRPDAAAPPHPAPRIVTIAKRPSSTGRDTPNIREVWRAGIRIPITKCFGVPGPGQPDDIRDSERSRLRFVSSRLDCPRFQPPAQPCGHFLVI